MATAACSSTYITGRELFDGPRAHRKGLRPPKLCVGDIVALYASVHGHLSVRRKKHFFTDKAAQHFCFCNEKRLGPMGTSVQFLEKSIFKGWYIERQCIHLIKAIATVEPYCFIPTESMLRDDSSFRFDPNSESQVAKSSYDTLELDERERLRRMRISKANKGNIPWNKGRKHSPETLQRIRERTKLAMQDPKVKMKLANLGHAQSDETKKKIGVGVRQGWERRREILVIQESCLLEWQDMIAEASRKGYAGEVELQWDSYIVIDEQLKQAWLESIEKRKSMPRPKGSRRAPKSLEQRRKISEAISAKWADPEYRNRVYAALAKYHGTAKGAERKPRRKSTSNTLPEKRVPVNSEPVQNTQINSELKSSKRLPFKKRKSSVPSYKDPMTLEKLELLRKIRAERAEMETKKREAIMRANLLIAEAERAARALEVAALKSPLAKASLLETRKLIAEATSSIESIEKGQLMSRECGGDSYFIEPTKYLQISPSTTKSETVINEPIVNGFQTLSSGENGSEGFDINQVRMTYEMNGSEAQSVVHGEQVSRRNRGNFPSLQPINERADSDRAEPVAQDKNDLGSRKPNDSKVGATRTKKWVCGRLVDVED